MRPLLPNCVRKTRPTHPGFTLVELLVVIAIIGTLVALLLPAVQSARETARGNTCRNNLKQLSFAMANYDTTQGKLPGYVNELSHQGSPKQANGDFAVGRRASWMIMAFPYIENNPLWDRWTQSFMANTASSTAGDVDSTTDLPELVNFQCPSDPPENIGQPSTSYVANAGQGFADPSRLVVGNEIEFAANGVFFDLNRKRQGLPSAGWSNLADGREPGGGNEQPQLQMTINYIQGADGTSKTMMISENIHAVWYTYPFDADTKNVPDGKHHFGFVFHNELASAAPLFTTSTTPNTQQLQRINGGLAREVTTPDSFSADTGVPLEEWMAYPSSNHPGGVNVAFCDGRVQFLSENVDYRIYAQSMTTKYKRSKYYDRSVTGSNLDKFLPQPSDSDLQ